MTAGEAAERDNIAIYNCAYLAINNKRAFSEALYILMNGTGVGFSCERQEISNLPAIPGELNESSDTIVVGDSKLGWAKSFKKLLSSLWEGDIPRIDYSKVRPAGARLKTFGGRASGPEPLRDLFEFCIATFKEAKGRKLNSIEVHDILCKIGEVVVVGGVRRSALISLSNLTDRRMREAKVGAWWETNSQRALANNSVCYTEKPDVETFMEEWLSLIKSKSGERGIFSRVASQRQAAKWGRRNCSFVKLTLEDGSIQRITKEEFDAKSIKVGDNY
jgi:ribonucleoside-diphosphate reductase alpha chain